MRGLTTAASIWVTAAIGSAAGTGLPMLAILAAGIYFLVAVAFPMATRRLPRSATRDLRAARPVPGIISRHPARCPAGGHHRGFAIDDVATEALGYRRRRRRHREPRPRTGQARSHATLGARAG